MSALPMPETVTLTGAAGNRLIADRFGAGGQPVLLLHGGGQTRHSWDEAAARLAARGHVAYAVDQRGHGESEWVADGAYAFADYAEDAIALARALTALHGARPIVVGASLGGIAGLMAEGETCTGPHGGVLSALILVDIVPRMDPGGVDRIQGFMGARMVEGFASVEEAADAIAAYLPHRARPKSLDGLAKNLRRHPDGRLRWHWDPRFIAGPRTINTDREHLLGRWEDATRRLRVPTLLIRGGRSELVNEVDAKAFLDLAPHARFTDVSDAGHMVAGDRNDIFVDAVMAFLETLETAAD
jgi:pimeloyl-ACP methyl ester carboxylesterase